MESFLHRGDVSAEPLTCRITIAFFCISGLDLLGTLEDETTPEERAGWVEWIWRLQSREASSNRAEAPG